MLKLWPQRWDYSNEQILPELCHFNLLFPYFAFLLFFFFDFSCSLISNLLRVRTMLTLSDSWNVFCGNAHLNVKVILIVREAFVCMYLCFFFFFLPVWGVRKGLRVYCWAILATSLCIGLKRSANLKLTWCSIKERWMFSCLHQMKKLSWSLSFQVIICGSKVRAC